MTTIVLSSTPLAEWHGSLTTFKGFTGTAPDLELESSSWKEIAAVLCPNKPVILADKKTGRYGVPCLLKEAPLVGRTLEFAKVHFRPTVGKQRSKGHVTPASFIIMDIDGVAEVEFAAGLDLLQQASISYLAYTTYSHGMPDKYGVRARVCIPIDTPASIEEYFVAWQGVDARFWRGQAGAKDASGANLYQQQGTWAANLATVQHARCWRFDGGVASTAALIEIGKATPACQVGVKKVDRPRQIDMADDTQNTAGTSVARSKAVASLTLLAVLLKFIDPGCGYDEWIHVGMALAKETGGSDDGLRLFDSWSSHSHKYRGEKETSAKWRSFDPDREGGYTVATLFSMVKDVGVSLEEILDEAEPFEMLEGEDGTS
jgi:hypothetical protein